jgi:uncharacterized membrane protein
MENEGRVARVAERVGVAHRFLAGWSFYALVCSSALAYALLGVRVYRTLSPAHIWLAWNLVLAWVPYLVALWAATIALRRPRQPWRLLPPGVLWLGFLPNAPYLVTDLMHVGLHRNETWLFWYDLVLLATFAWTGCVLGVTSLRVMQGLVAAYAGRLVSWLFVLAASGLCGVGIYLGRFHRWNSWDLLLNPRGILADALAGLSQPTSHLRPWGLVALFAAFVLVTYLTLGASRPAVGLTVAAPEAQAPATPPRR